MFRQPTSRRALLKGAAGLTVVAAGAIVWRAWDNGAFHVGGGPAYEPWRDWREAGLDGPLALVRSGILASNAHNTQPWRFRVTDGRITLYADHHRHLGSFDPFRREMALSLGCALENMVETARAQGLEARAELIPGRLSLGGPDDQSAPVAVLHLTEGERADGELFQAIARRHTHRGPYDRHRPIPAELQREMQALASDNPRVRLVLLNEAQQKVRLGELIVSATEAIVSDDEMAMDSARWFRFDWRSIQEHRDGVTLDTVGLPPLINAVAKIVPAPSPEDADRQWLDATREIHVPTAPLFGLIGVRDLYDQPTALEAGRLWQRLHLWATARGLSAQPLNMPPEVVDRDEQLGRPPLMAESLSAVTGEPDWRPTFVFRMGYAERPARLSPRRPLDAVLAA